MNTKNFNIKMNNCKVIKTRVYASPVFLLLAGCVLCSGIGAEPASRITGAVYDASYPAGENVPIAGARIEFHNNAVYSDKTGHFSLPFSRETDPRLKITADKFHAYREKYSRAENGGFYLIPSDLYNDFKLLTWNRTPVNPQNRHRKWAGQPEFFIVKNRAGDEQINFLTNTLNQDPLASITGGLYHSNLKITVLEHDPGWTAEQKYGKMIFYFSEGIIEGGIACSFDTDNDGTIEYSEASYDRGQKMSENIIRHELSHMVTAGGHINYRQSINNEIKHRHGITARDIAVLNCIYNSPPGRSN
ncbi:MAG: hypothetical protein PHO30_08980 [Candidatus Omnitrophica bacterium]|nr:hypothetical protein [Candidatus Omnitrophota bacterium]